MFISETKFNNKKNTFSRFYAHICSYQKQYSFKPQSHMSFSIKTAAHIKSKPIIRTPPKSVKLFRAFKLSICKF